MLSYVKYTGAHLRLGKVTDQMNEGDFALSLTLEFEMKTSCQHRNY